MLSNFKAKPKTETVRIDLGEEGDFIELKSMSDKKFIDDVARTSKSKTKTWRKSFQGVKDDKELKAFCAAMARNLIVDWQLTNDKKEFKTQFPDIETDSRADLDKKFCNIPFTFATAYALLMHKDYEQFFEMVFTESQDKAQFEIIDLDKDLKN